MTEPLFQEDAYMRACDAVVTAVDSGGIILDRTVFYPAGGGQAGDSGTLVTPEGTAYRIVDTRKSQATGAILHLPAAADGSSVALPAPGTTVQALIDWPRRYRLMRLHSAMHLLCALVPAPVTGGSITSERAHLDFDIEMEKLGKEAIESGLNALVAAGHPVTPRWISDAELAAKPELVRTMSVKPPMGSGRVRLLEIIGVDLQPCGGTHVRDTAEVGALQVIRIRSEGRRNKRVVVTFAQEPS